MRAMLAPNGSDAVQAYRFMRAANHMDFLDKSILKYDGADLVDGHKSDIILKWLEKNGLGWDVVWTGDYSLEMGVALDIIRGQSGARVVVDVDDWFEEVPAGNMARAAWYGKKRALYRTLLEEADQVLASTPFLADKYDGDVAPNFVDPSEWEGEIRPKKRPNEVVICCPAGTGRAGDYAELREVLKAALELPNVKCFFMGMMPSWATDYPAGKVIRSRWVPFGMYGKMMRWISPDIILSPMIHNDFNLAKSNLKWLESGAVGACFMGERWGEYQRTVLDGVTGVLADTEDEWTQRLLWLCTEHDARQEIAAAGAKDVAENWTWGAVKDAWIQGVLGDGASDNRVACGAG